MQYNITLKEKQFQQNLLVQFFRLMVLSLKFMKLTRAGGCRTFSPTP